MLVGLDLSSMDDYILSFLKTHAHALTYETIDIIHVDEDRGSSSSDLVSEIERNIPKELEDFDIHLREGDPEEELKLFSESKNIDLAVFGHKPTNEHEVEVKRLVKKPFCSLLLVPKKEDYTINKIGVAIDFSEYSMSVLKKASTLAEKTGAKLLGLHTYQVPSGYHKTGKDHWEFAEKMEENAKKRTKAFLKEAGVDSIEMHYKYDKEKKSAKYIASLVQETGVDLLVMGSKGRTGPASLLIDSVAKETIQMLNEIPIMIIKRKNENMDLLDALKEI